MTEQESQIETVNAELTELEGEFSDLTKKKIHLLEKKIAALDKLLKERDKAIEEVRVLRSLTSKLSPNRDAPLQKSASLNVVPGEFVNTFVWQAVEAVLRRERKELTTREIVDRLIAGGKKLNAKNPASNVYTSISDKEDVFYRARDGSKRTWGLVEWNKEREEQKARD